MKLLKFLMRSSKGVIFTAGFVGFLGGISNALLLAFISDTLGKGEPSTQKLVWFIGLALLVSIMNVAPQLLMVRLTQSHVATMRLDLSKSILRAPLRRLESFGAPRLYAALTDDIQSIAGTMTTLPSLVVNLTITLGCLAYMIWVSVPMFLCIFGVLLFGSLIYIGSSRVGVGRFKRARATQDRLFSLFKDNIDGIKELKLNQRRERDFLDAQLQPSLQDYRRHSVAASDVFNLVGSVTNFLFYAAIGILLFVLPLIMEIPQEALRSTVLIAVFMSVPFTSLMGAIPALGRARVAFEKIQEMEGTLAAKEALFEPGEARGQKNWQRLQLRGVTHQYFREDKNRRFVLGPIDLDFTPGEVVFLVGGNGSGKTTLAKLITGLYEPQAGEILLDGHPVSDENRAAYRQRFSAVFTDFHLFENMMGRDDPDVDREVRAYLEKLQLDYKVQVKQGNLSTVDLSGGQRKRLALVAAYLENRPIYLFDEWAAGQDPAFRDIFYKTLVPELCRAGKCVMIISHDDQYFHLGDRIVKLDYGRIVGDDPVPLAASAGSEPGQTR